MMGWIGLHDGRAPVFATGGLNQAGVPLPDDPVRTAAGACLTAGTLFVETRFPTQEPQKLVAASGAAFWPAQMMLHLWPQGRATLQIGDGAAGLQLVTEFPRLPPGERLRLMFRWSAAFNAAWLAVESPGRGMFAITRRIGPPPVPVTMLAQLFDLPLADGVSLLALSDRAEEIGLGPAMAEGTPVRTPGGWRAVETLRPGDMVLSADDGPVRLRDIRRRELPWAGSFAPAILTGEAGPVLLSPETSVLVPGPVTGREVLVRAAVLGEARAEAEARLVRYVDLTLERAHLVRAGGHWVETRAPTPGPVTRQRVASAA